MNRTREPGLTVSVCGQTALLIIRIVVAFGNVEHVSAGDGVMLEDAPHAAASASAKHAAPFRTNSTHKRAALLTRSQIALPTFFHWRWGPPASARRQRAASYGGPAVALAKAGTPSAN